MRRTLATSFTVSLLLFSVAQFPSVLAWETERPSATYTIDTLVQNATTNNAASLGLGVYMWEYEENHPDRGDNIELKIVATSNTRKIISYDVYDSGVHTDYEWHEVSEPVPNWQGGLDNGFGNLDLGDFPVRFYGGPKSGEYRNIWISANGFISFEQLTSPTDPYYYRDIPNTFGPNTFVAPFWRDLDLGSEGSITCGEAFHWPNPGPWVEVWVISWNDVPNKKNGVSQSFQILIEKNPLDYWQNRIWFQYKQITLDDATTIGIEDYGGWKGVSYDYLSLNNAKTLLMKQTSYNAYIDSLTIELNENDAYASTIIDRTPDFIRGHNVELNQALPEPDPIARYAAAFGGEVVLLIDAIDLLAVGVPQWVPGIGFMIGTVLFTAELAEEVARQQALAKLLEIDNYHVKAQAIESQPWPETVVDASLDITSFWMFTDPNDQDHELTITASLHYFEADAYGVIWADGTIRTSVTLSVLREVEPKSVSVPIETIGFLGVDDTEDSLWYLLHDYNFYHKVVLTPHAQADVKLELYEYNPDTGSTSLIAVSDTGGLGQTESITEGPFVYAHLHRLVKVVYKSGPNLKYYLHIFKEPSDGGGGGGGGGGPTCPTLFVWNGTDYAEEGVLDIHADSDVTVEHEIQNTLALTLADYVYKLQLRELDNFTSHIDQVKLLAVRDSGETIECPLIAAMHSEDRNVLSELLRSDDIRTDTAPNEYVSLKFQAPTGEIESFIFVIEGYNYKTIP